MNQEPPAEAAGVVEVRDLSRRFGAKLALDGVSLSIPAGSVMGLVGQNGAGKTTLIKHVLGLLKAQAGSVRVFGLDPVAEPVRVLSDIGYLSEDVDLPVWMRVHELMRYSQALYPAWDPGYADQLRQDFGLEARARLRDLSKGQRARAGLIVALAHRPALLLLDEPSSGLDPLVRRDILAAIIRTIADEGRTVLFSSHLLSEVERVSDWVAMLRDGRVAFCGSLDDVHRAHYRLTLRFPEGRAIPPLLAGALAWTGEGREWTAVCTGRPPDLEAQAAGLGAQVVEREPASLDEIFMARAGARPGQEEEG